MTLCRLGISHIRNISNANVELSNGVNLFVGPNGSGKTSILESVYFLGSGRSFRNNSVEPLISRGEQACVVFGSIIGKQNQRVTLGVKRGRDGSREIRRNGEKVQRASLLARSLPTIVLGPDTIELLTGPPANRRQFLNWGVFHVEPSFAELWEQMTRCLRQRNELIRHPAMQRRELDGWNDQLVSLAEQIDQQRSRYFDHLSQAFGEIVTELAGLSGVSCTYYCGWDSTEGLARQLERQLEGDQQRGFTQAGPHRADIRLRIGRQAVATAGSRGELKILAWSLVLAQGRVFDSLNTGTLVYLVDDLAAELDQDHRRKVCALLENTGAQILVTGIDRSHIVDNWRDADIRVFHVEHGEFSEEERQDERR
ncbi:MAG: DNA replication/repair protein RecF [Pseudomonadota bacterium]